MNKLGTLDHAARFAPGLLKVRRTTWLAVGVGLLVLLGLLIWVAVSLMGWLWGQTQNLSGSAPEAARGALAQVKKMVPGALAQVKEIVPGALAKVDEIAPGVRAKLGEFVPALKPQQAQQLPPLRDVSGTDLGPVARYPGLTRTHWQREGGQAAVGYEGQADYARVLDHYAKGFAAQGYAQTVQSATQEAEAHEYTKGRERVIMKIVQKPKGGVNVRIESALS